MMTYNAKIKLSYINDSDVTPSKYFPEIVDQQTITIEAPAQDLNVHQYFELFKSFLRAVGFNEYNIMDAACRVAFNDNNRQDDMQKLADEYDLILAEDQGKKVIELENKIHAQEKQILELKAKLSRFQQIDNPQYTDEEMDAMCYEEGK